MHERPKIQQHVELCQKQRKISLVPVFSSWLSTGAVESSGLARAIIPLQPSRESRDLEIHV
jgi:hypothetical protein